MFNIINDLMHVSYVHTLDSLSNIIIILECTVIIVFFSSTIEEREGERERRERESVCVCVSGNNKII